MPIFLRVLVRLYEWVEGKKSQKTTYVFLSQGEVLWGRGRHGSRVVKRVTW